VNYSPFDGHRLAQAVSENPKALHADPVQPLQHLVGYACCDNRLLQRVAVDQHGRLQRLKAGNPHCVEYPGSGPAKIRLTSGHGPHDLLLSIVREVTVSAPHLDAEIAARALLDLGHKVLDRGKAIQLAVGVAHLEYDGCSPATGLVVSRFTTAAPHGQHGDRHCDAKPR
jgi:hypothetical protein